MKNITVITILLIFVSVPCFSKSELSEYAITDQYFDSYNSNISWQKQKVHHDNFAIYLMKNPEMIGYIGYYTEEKESKNKAKNRINRAVKYLVNHRKISRNRIVVIYAGESEGAQTILQPVDKGLPSPFESPKI